MRESYFEKKSADRKDEQATLEAKATKAKPSKPTSDPLPEKRTLISVSITESDKALIKRYAFENGATVSGLISKWIRENCKI